MFKAILRFMLITAGVVWLIAGFMGLGLSSAYGPIPVARTVVGVVTTIIIAMLFFLAAIWIREGKNFNLKRGVISIVVRGVMIYAMIFIATAVGVFISGLVNSYKK